MFDGMRMVVLLLVVQIEGVAIFDPFLRSRLFDFLIPSISVDNRVTLEMRI